MEKCAVFTRSGSSLSNTGKCIRQFGGVLLVLHRPKVVDIGVNTIYRIRSFLSIRHAHGDLCKHLGIDSSTDLDDRYLDDRYSNLFPNAYINRHAHTE